MSAVAHRAWTPFGAVPGFEGRNDHNATSGEFPSPCRVRCHAVRYGSRDSVAGGRASSDAPCRQRTQGPSAGSTRRGGLDFRGAAETPQDGPASSRHRPRIGEEQGGADQLERGWRATTTVIGDARRASSCAIETHPSPTAVGQFIQSIEPGHPRGPPARARPPTEPCIASSPLRPGPRSAVRAGAGKTADITGDDVIARAPNAARAARSTP